LEVAEESDALVVVTEWSEFRSLDLAKLAAVMNKPLLVDGRNIFRPEQAAAAGFDYSGVGRVGAAAAHREVGVTTA
jgi:UDPglucose 6-dehydrogenase